VEIVDKLNKEINAGLADPRMKTRLADLGGTVLAGADGYLAHKHSADLECQNPGEHENQEVVCWARDRSFVAKSDIGDPPEVG
jgi:hypothetical protein